MIVHSYEPIPIQAILTGPTLNDMEAGVPFPEVSFPQLRSEIRDDRYLRRLRGPVR